MQDNINKLNSVIQSLARYDREQEKIIADLREEINVRIQREQYLLDRVKATRAFAQMRAEGVLPFPERTWQQEVVKAEHILRDLAEKRTLQYPTLSPKDHQVWLRRNDTKETNDNN